MMRESHARGRARKNNTCTHTIVQAAPVFKYEHSYPTGYFTSHDPQKFFKHARQLHVESSIMYSHLITQQIDSRYNCAMNLTEKSSHIL